MQKTVKHKVKNGKLLEIRIIYGEKIQELKILGDFFIYPDESLEIIEKELVGVRLNLNSIEEDISLVMEQTGVTDREKVIAAINESKGDIASAIMKLKNK